jgi:DNA repair protein RadC
LRSQKRLRVPINNLQWRSTPQFRREAAVFVRELQIRYQVKRVADSAAARRRVRTPRDAMGFLQSVLRDEAVEVCGLICLSTKHEVLAYHEVSRGTIDGTIMNPRDVFRAALLANAPAVIVVHNHPSGDPNPSPNDLAVARRIRAAGLVVGVELPDFLIVGLDRVYSVKEAGLF